LRKKQAQKSLRVFRPLTRVSPAFFWLPLLWDGFSLEFPEA
jgi:hypothetical protein